MFTGIVEQVGKVEKIEGNRFTISHPFEELFEIGESVALSGMCTTVIEATEKSFTVEIMKESRDRTTFGKVLVGEMVNLERAAKIGDRNSGHFVTGHIDEVGEILSRERVGDYWKFRIGFSVKNAALVVEKGSVAIDGVSLTISELGKNWFEVAIISHTFDVTTFGQKDAENKVNLEFDVIGKYIQKNYELRMSNDE